MVSQKPLYHQAKKRLERLKRHKLGRRLFKKNNSPTTPTRSRQQRFVPPSLHQSKRSKSCISTPDSKTKIPKQAVSMKPFHQNAKIHKLLIDNWRRKIRKLFETKP